MMIAEVGGIVNVSGSRIATPFGPAQARQHADDDAQHQADQHHQAVVPGHRDGEPMKQGFEIFH